MYEIYYDREWRRKMIFDWINNNKYGLLVYLIINLVVFAMYGIDKWKAVHDKWRIPENTLISGALFGVVGAILGMVVFHHKIRKPKFYITVPLILIIELVCTGYVIYSMV